MPAKLRFVLKRLLQVVPVVLAIAALNFLLLHLAPGDAADIIAAQSGGASAEFVAELRRSFGLDRPLYQQFFIYIARLLTFDLGFSNVQQRPVFDLIADRVPATLLLMLVGITLALILGTLLGILAAMWHRRWVDAVVSVLALIAYATPQFWLGLMLIVLCSITLGILPSGGMMTIATHMSWGARTLDIARHLLLPTLTLGLFYLACRALGMSDVEIIMRQILPNALPSVIVVSSLLVATAILTESGLSFLGLSDPNVISWGYMIGVGRTVLRVAWWMPAIPGIAILVTVLCINLIGEGLNDALNPRLQRR